MNSLSPFAFNACAVARIILFVDAFPPSILVHMQNRCSMGRAMRWFKKLLTGRKERDKGLKENHVAGDWHDGTDREKGRWSFVKQRKSGVDGGRRPSEAAAAEPSQVTPCHCGGEGARTREERAAVVIQKAFRGYLARKALRALRGLVQLQALVRGYLVRKQAATTLHRLQALMRLQADSYAVKTASHRNSMEQERIVTQVARMKPLATPGHRRRLSDSTDSNYESSPRIVEMDTCHLRSRSTRIVSSRYTPDHSSDRRLTPALASSCSPLSRKQPPRLSIRRCHERDPRRAKTAQNTPRCFGPAPTYGSPAKSVDGLTSRRLSHRDVLVSPSYMADTASFAARMRCQSASNQRQAEAPRASLTRAGSRKSCSQMQDSAFSTQTGCSGLSVEAARDYYLDRMW